MALVPVNREEMLAGHFLLRHLRPDELSRVAANATVVRHPSHTTIFQKGDAGTSMMAVISGRVKICVFSGDGKEVVLNYIDRGSLFGEIAVLDGRERSADAVTIEATELLVLERARVLPILTANPEIVTQVINILCQRLRQTSTTLEDALLRDAPVRIARSLLRLAETFGKPTAHGLRLDIKLSQTQLGSLIGISREHTNKYLVEWGRAGYLTFKSGVITIHDRDALENLSDTEL